MERKLINMLKGIAVKFTAFLMTFLFLFEYCVGNVYADDDMVNDDTQQFVIESVQAVMPEIKAYIRGSRQVGVTDITGSLDGVELTVDNVELFEKTGQGITYYVLLDVSASFSESYFSALKDSLITFYNSLSDNDSLVLITFGSSVNTVLNGDETSEQVQEAIMSLVNGDEDTFFYEALLQAAEETDRNDINSREVIMMISDGGDDHNNGKANEQEAIAALNKRSIPVYGFAAGANQNNLESFRYVTNACGGTVTEFTSQETDKIFTNFVRMLGEMQVVTLSADSNIPSNKTETLQLTLLSDGSSASGNVLITEHIPDDTAPTIAAVRKSSDKELIINFSERVSGADKATAYIVTCDGTMLDVMTAEYNEKEYSAVISFNSELRPGEYVIEARDIKDVSVEENPVTESFNKIITDTDESDNQEDAEDNSGKSYLIYIIVGGIVIVLVIVCIVIVFIVRKKKAKREKKEQRLEEKNIPGQSDAPTKYVEKSRNSSTMKFQTANGRRMVLEILNTEAGGNNRIEAELNKSLIVGRADICDVHIRDKSMSRQHFSLEEKNGAIYIRDLQTTNGTRVNGEKLTGLKQLNKNDVISAGSTKIRIRW